VKQEREVTIQDFWNYVMFRGIGCKGQFAFSVRHYIHYSIKTIKRIMQSAFDYILLIGDMEYRKVVLEILYYTTKNYMVPQLKSRGESIPEIFFKIEKLHKKLNYSMMKKM